MLKCIHCSVVICLMLIVAPFKAHAGFIYSAITEQIVSATFSADIASLTAHRRVGGFEVNSLVLSSAGNITELDLGDAFFGNSDLALGDAAAIDQGLLETGITTIDIPSTFFSVLQTGRVGLQMLLTDTRDGLFAIDFLSLQINTLTSSITSFIDSNDGFDVGIADNGALFAPLPVSIGIGVNGSGFDEAVSSKNIQLPIKMSEPSSFFLSIVALSFLLFRRSQKSRLIIVQ